MGGMPPIEAGRTATAARVRPENRDQRTENREQRNRERRSSDFGLTGVIGFVRGGRPAGGLGGCGDESASGGPAVDHGVAGILHELGFSSPFGNGAGNIHDVVALGAREVEEDLVVVRIEFLVDGVEGAEKKAAGISHDGAAAGRDLVGGEEFVEFAEDVVDVHSGMEVLDAADESFGEVAGVDFLEAKRSVAEAEAGFRVRDGEAAVRSGANAMAAMRLGCRELMGFDRRLAAAGFGRLGC